MKIVITGSPGTGKSEIARLLSKKMKLKLIDIKKIVEEQGLCEGPDCEVDVRKLASVMEFPDDNYVVEGHLACEIKIPADFIFVLRTDPEVLRERLAGREYDKEKLNENLMAEMLDYCTQRTEKVYSKKPLELDTSSRTVQDSVLEIEKAIKHKKKKLDSVDYSEALARLLEVQHERGKETD